MKRLKSKTNRSFFNASLLALAFIVFIFNFTFKINTKAGGAETIINVENLLSQHNLIRTNLSLTPLQISTELTNSAIAKGQAMLQTDCWSHYCPDGASPWQFFDNAGYQFVFAGENLAEGFYNVDTLMNAWMNSPTHRENIVNGNYREVGFGIITGSYQENTNNILVVVHFGSRLIPEPVIVPEITITTPTDGQVVDSQSIDIQGNVQNIENVDVFLNDQKATVGRIEDGIFTSRLDQLREGTNEIYVNGTTTTGTTIQSNPVGVNFQPQTNLPITQISNETQLFTISGDAKNLVNLGFVLGLAIIFLIDFIIVSRTTMLGRGKSFSHYHFAMFIITAGVILIGGFSGQISSGLQI